jgi:ribbon-helix-helix protein, copG family
MSKKQEETYRLAGGITVTDADLEADAQRFEAGECDGAWKVLPGRPQLVGEEQMPDRVIGSTVKRNVNLSAFGT